MPKSSTPALLEIQVRSFTPFFTKAAIQFSGIPHRPNPPNKRVIPSLKSRSASSAFFTTLLIIIRLYFPNIWLLGPFTVYTLVTSYGLFLKFASVLTHNSYSEYRYDHETIRKIPDLGHEVIPALSFPKNLGQKIPSRLFRRRCSSSLQFAQ